jgi:predicted deacylase
MRIFRLSLLPLLCICLGLLSSAPTLADQSAPLVRDLLLGYSGQGRPISAVQIGDGPRKLVVVGDTHGGPEANTYTLTLQLAEHYRANPAEVPPEARLYLIPTLNPDGLALGTRFDAQGVDLNRNMNTNLDACPENDWSVTVQGAYGQISDTGGPYPDSQVETRLIRNFLLDAAGAIFIHSNAGLVFPAFCEHAPSNRMGQVYAEAAGYRYNRYWPNYQITGGMHDWAGSLGIAAITPELISGADVEFPQNLAGLRAVLANWPEVLPLPEDRIEANIVVPALIWRYWKALGSVDVFGLPIQPAQPTPDGLTQTFQNARLELRRSLADTAYLVQPQPLGQRSVEALAYGGSAALVGVDPATAPRYFAETGHSLRESFLLFWERNGGVDVFGLPLSEEFTARTADRQQRIVQYFERAVFAYYPEDGRVRLEPLGEQMMQRERWDAPTTHYTAR